MDGVDLFSLDISEAEYGVRLDVVLSDHLRKCSRSAAADWIKNGLVLVQGEHKKPSYRVRLGDQITGRLPQPQPTNIVPEPIDFDVLYEDEAIIVINKRAGMVVHPAPGHASGTVVNGILYRCPDLAGKSAELRPGIVHRLDKDTSGTLIIAKDPVSHANLSEQFKTRQVIKKYLTVVHGAVRESCGQILKPVGRHPTERKKMSVNSKVGRPAETHWELINRFCDLSMLQVQIKTGRTHQIRVHCASIMHPIVGDPLYGPRKFDFLKIKNDDLIRVLRKIKRQMLHAWQLEIRHPLNDARMVFESPLPEDMKSLIGLFQAPSKIALNI